MIVKKALFDFFKISLTPSLALLPDAPRFTIEDANGAFLEMTQCTLADVIGKGVFELFPDSKSNPATNGIANLTKSLNSICKTGKKHHMPVQKYHIPVRGTAEFDIQYWESENIPFFTDDGQLNYIILCIKNVTATTKADNLSQAYEYFFNNSNDFFCIANT